MARRIGRFGSVLHTRPALRLAGWVGARLSPLLRQSGWIANPAVLGTESVERGIAAAMVAVPAAAISYFLVSPWGALLVLVPLLAFVTPELEVRDRVARRREGVERELPFFSVVVNVLAEAGVPLYSILCDLASSDLFAAMKKEAMLVRRDVTVFGMNPNDSIERLASSHPSGKFADFLLGYTSKVRSGGDVALYLAGESGALLRGLEDGWARYTDRVGIIGSMMITTFGVVPLLVTVVGVFSPNFSVVGLLVFTGLGVPLVTIGLLYMAGRMQPMREEPVRGEGARSLLLALPGALVGYLIGGAWVSAGAALVIFLASYGMSVRGQIAESRAIEAGLARFLKDLLEYKRQEYDLTRAILAVHETAKYNPRFTKLLARVVSQLRAGVPLDELSVECRSGLGRVAFLLLGQMSRSGGGTVDTVFQISSFADRMTEMKRNVADEMKPYVFLSYLSPLLLAFGITFVGDVLSSFNGVSHITVGGLHIGSGQGPSPIPLTQVSDVLIVVSAASLGLIGAKITDFTVRSTLKAAANVALAVVAIALIPVIFSHGFPLFPKS